MRTVIIGSGNVAEALARTLTSPGTNRPGHTGPHLVQIYSRNSRQGQALAEKVGVPYTGSLAELSDADLYILAVSDNAVGQVSAQMNVPPHAVVAHTAGSLGAEALSGHIPHRAVIYPLQTFTKGRDLDMRNIPVFIEYSTPRAEDTVRSFACSLSAKILESTSEVRTKLHLAAVFACNFTNHMYAIAGRILESEGLPFAMIEPLIGETAAKAVASGDPGKVQTGPAVRGDGSTRELHIRLLEEAEKNKGMDETYREIYKLLSKSIWETSKKK